MNPIPTMRSQVASEKLAMHMGSAREGAGLTRLQSRSMRSILRLPLIAIALFVVLGSAHQARAQTANDVSINVLQFGVDGKARPGDWAGIQLEIVNNTSTPQSQDALVIIEAGDGDGDRIQYAASHVLQASTTKRVWMYVWLPYGLEPGSTLPISVHAAEERDTDERGALKFRPTRLLGKFEHVVMQPTNPANSMIGIIGNRPAGGLRLYSDSGQPSEDFLPLGHELTRIVDSLQPSQLPDRWMGLSCFESIVWSSDTGVMPTSLTSDQAPAIREWVARGGHLIIVMPTTGQQWLNTPSNPLRQIMPEVTFSREPTDLRPFKTLLTHKSDRELRTDLPETATRRRWWSDQSVHFFEPIEGAPPEHARAIMSGPDGRAFAVRRLVGRGAVTLLGMDVMSERLRRADAVDPNVFWHRILGRRAELVTRDELDRRQEDNTYSPLLTSRVQMWLDDLIAGRVDVPGRAALGLLLAFLVFGLYWFVAGPVSYLALKQRRKKHHAWVAFVLAGVTFTAIAWGGATLFRPTKVEGRHLTILDHVYGQHTQAARSWISVLLPSYGSATLAVDSQGDDLYQSITPWQSPTELAAIFPDARGYLVDAREPDSLTVPTRATVKQFQVDWAGFAPWEMIHPVTDPAANIPIGEEIRLIPSNGRTTVHGTLTHDLPGALDDVMVILVERARRAGLTAMIPAETRVATLAEPWNPGQPLDLSAVIPAKGIRNTADAAFKTKLTPRVTRTIGAGTSTHLMAQSFMHMLEPPETKSNSDQQPLYRRRAMHGWDLSRWFTEPCVIVVGQLRRSECPIPIRVDGRDADDLRSRFVGDTVVRWVYPLPPDALKPSVPGPVRPTGDN